MPKDESLIWTWTGNLKIIEDSNLAITSLDYAIHDLFSTNLLTIDYKFNFKSPEIAFVISKKLKTEKTILVQIDSLDL